MRADTTVVEADVKYPTDSGLLTKAIGKAARLVDRIKSVGAAPRTRVVDHVEKSRVHAHEIGAWLRRRTGDARDEVLAITGKVAVLASETMDDAVRVVRNARRHLRRNPDTPKAGRVSATICDLETLIERARRVLDQTEQASGGRHAGGMRLGSFRCTIQMPVRSGKDGSVSLSSSATRPRSLTTMTGSFWTTVSRSGTPTMPSSSSRRSGRVKQPGRESTRHGHRRPGLRQSFGRQRTHRRHRCRNRGDPQTRQTDRETKTGNGHRRVPRTRPMENRRRRPDRCTETTTGMVPKPAHQASKAPEPGADTESSHTTSPRSSAYKTETNPGNPTKPTAPTQPASEIQNRLIQGEVANHHSPLFAGVPVDEW